jgi:hypothetical protein
MKKFMLRQKGETNMWLVGGLCFAFLALASGAFAVGYGSQATANGGDNTLGAQNVLAANPADPKILSLLGTIQEAANPAKFIQLNASQITSVLGVLDDLQSYWESKPILAKTDTASAQAQLDILRTSYQALETMVNSSSTANGKPPDKIAIGTLHDTILKANATLHTILDSALAGGPGTAQATIQLAVAIASKNSNGSIPYRKGMSPEISSGSVKNGQYNGKSLVDAANSMDSSGFLSYVLIGAGVITSHEDTEELANDRTNFTIINADANGDGKVQAKDIQDSLATGVIQPGDIIVTGLSGGKKVEGKSHALMFIANNFTDDHGLVQSTSSAIGNGPQFGNVQKRAQLLERLGSSWGDNVVVVRPNYRS